MNTVLRPDLFAHEVRPPANGLVGTRTGILIGCRHVRGPAPLPADEELIQRALLEPRTARPLPWLQRIAGACWAWC